MSRKRSLKKPQLIVRCLSPASSSGWLHYGPLRWPCAIGRGGIRANKKEGDGATPRGVFVLRRIFYRADKGPRPITALSMGATSRAMGWCDAVGNGNYNRAVRFPYPASAEHLWRADDLYDLIVVLSHNERPRIQARGSAVFIHVARPGLRPTEGCVALKKSDLRKVLQHAKRNCKIVIP